MNAPTASKTKIRVAVLENDPLCFVGFRTLLDAEPEFELVSTSIAELRGRENLDPAAQQDQGRVTTSVTLPTLVAARTIPIKIRPHTKRAAALPMPWPDVRNRPGLLLRSSEG